MRTIGTAKTPLYGAQINILRKATVNEIHVSGHPPARNFNGRINWSLLVTYVIIGHVI